jgi:hypothetical protein
LSHPNDGTIVRRQALRLVEHLRLLTDEIDELTVEITARIIRIALSLLTIVGCGALSAAKIIGETAHAGRFRSKYAYAVTTAPHPFRCGRRTNNGIACHAPAIGNSTRRYTASR